MRKFRVDQSFRIETTKGIFLFYSTKLDQTLFSLSFFIRPSDKRGIEMARYRNMRSKRQCSLCLQFALILGAGPVLHRPTSLVIHRLEWNRTRFFVYI